MPSGQKLSNYIYFFVLLVFTNQLAAQSVNGTIFEDLNTNGFLESGEPGIAGVVVSNQVEAVQTDEEGRYTLSVREPMVIFVSKPAGYQFPLNEVNLPQYFYIHNPAGSPDTLLYPGIPPTGLLPEEINFPVYKVEVNERFNILVSGDPQPTDSVEVGYFRDDIINDMIGKDAAFYIALGDIANDNLDIYDQYNRAVSKLGIPAYNVPGNHDSNYKSKDDVLAMETFKRVFGPNYYSFNYGKVHFVVLDVVDYFGWNAEEEKPRHYRGYINPDQLEWLENDLSYVPEDRLVVLTMHIPIYVRTHPYDGVVVVNRAELFDILEDRQHLLALSGHMHTIEHLNFDEKMGWEGSAKFPGINVGAGCGAWWSGPKDARGIPVSYCMDGSPNGYYLFQFDGNKYDHHFYAANMPEDYQLRIFSPDGVIHKSAIDTLQIIINAFNATPEARVEFRIDRGPASKMENQFMKDPFVTHYLKTYRKQIAGWLKGGVATSHIWTALLPENLESGTHLLEVTVTEPRGVVYTGSKIFEIE